MKLKELKKIINEQVLIVLNETIYGENAIVFHRTNVSDLVNKVYTTGFHAGAPETVGEDFICAYNRLTSLTGAPKTVGEDFYCFDNSKKFTENDVTSVCKVKGTIRV